MMMIIIIYNGQVTLMKLEYIDSWHCNGYIIDV